MKNERISELFIANIDRLYAATKEKHGEKAEDALMDAVRKTAGKYKKLGEKAYITLLLQELGVGAFYEAEESAPFGLAEKLEVAFEEGLLAAKKRGRKYALLGGAVAVCLAVVVCIAVVVFWLFLRPGKGPGEVTLNGSKEYAFGDFAFTNVHCINDYVEFQERIRGNDAEQNAAVATAPDGTVYFLAVTASDSSRMDTVSLYRMEPDDWVELCNFEVYRDSGREASGHFLSIFCDVQSRVFLFNYTMATNRLEARLYDPQTGECKVVGESRNISFVQTNGRACSDGEAAYFACNSVNNPWCNTIVYDFETMEFSISGVEMSGSGWIKELVHRNGRTYLLAGETNTYFDENGKQTYESVLVVYCFENYGTDKQNCVFRSEIGPTINYGVYLSRFYENIRIDDEGNVYVIYTEANWSTEPAEERYVLEVLSPNGECLYINEYDSILQSGNGTTFLNAAMCSFFFGTDGELYILEQATVSPEGSLCCVVGRFSGEKHETLEVVTDTIMLDEEIIVPVKQKYSSDPVKDGWIADFICKNTSGDGWYSYMRLRMK